MNILLISIFAACMVAIVVSYWLESKITGKHTNPNSLRIMVKTRLHDTENGQAFDHWRMASGLKRRLAAMIIHF
jgi:hypothetical protein